MKSEEQDKPKVLSQNLFPVVGIGASAGGLDAFRKFIHAIPEHSGMAYILVQHLHPGHESSLPEILQRVTSIPVVEISDNVTVQPDHIYVIPSNKMMVATDGVLLLSPRSTTDKLNLPIDLFFSSLADVHQSHAIGVVLSGNGSDGTMGLQAIKEHGGLTFAQDPATAAYNGMPQHAINADIVDFIIAPESISAKLMELHQSFKIAANTDVKDLKDKVIEDGFRNILALLRVKVGVDFNFYKQTTVRRRIIRRMVMLKKDSIAGYQDYLKKNKAELDILFQDLLIPVTSFFRDSATFETLCETVFPEVIKNKKAGTPIRIWIAGCSTGQEAYSVAICMHEFLGENDGNGKVQIFATDLSEKAIKTARTGIYSQKEIEGISEVRLSQFFDKTDGNYLVKKPIRDMCVFAVHNFLKDPPFAKMDFISCRNVLIYLEPFLQKKALSIFHYALTEKGILWLGKSETTGTSSDLFLPFGKKDKLYIRKQVPGRFTNVISHPGETTTADKSFLKGTNDIKTDDFQKNADEILLSKYTPVGVVVNEQFDIVQFRGLTGIYLEPSPGKASLNVLKMAKDGLAFEIRNALHKAKATKEVFSKAGIPINNGKKLVTIEVIPLLNTVDLHFLILFTHKDVATGDAAIAVGKNKVVSAKIKKDQQEIRILQVEKELARAREDMLSITEDQEAVNEELQSANEELLSGSEELQSLNEELETSKEELQSTNEELITVNLELFERNEELNRSRKFAELTIASLHEPLLLLDKNYRIKSANRIFYVTFKLTEEETLGKVFFELQDNSWNIPGLRLEIEKIHTEKEKMLEAEIAFSFKEIGERTICFNIQSIIGNAGEEIILLTMQDITARKNAEKILQEKSLGLLKEHQLLHHLLMESPALFAILKGPDHIFEFANSMFHSFTGKTDIIGKSVKELFPELVEQHYLELLDKVYTTGVPFVGKEIPIFLNNIDSKSNNYFINFNYQPILDDSGKIEGVFAFAYDVTEIISSRKFLVKNAEMIKNLYMNAPAFVCTLMGPNHVYELVNASYQKLFGKREILGKPLMEALPELEGQGFEEILGNVYKTGQIFLGNEVPISLARDIGLEPEERFFNFSYQPIYNEDTNITGILVFGYEITDEIKGRKVRQEADKTFRLLADAMPQKMWTADEHGNVNYLNRQWYDFTQKTFDKLKDFGWENIIHPADWSQNKKNWENAIRTGDDFEMEHRFLCFDGSYRWHLSRGHAQKDDTGKVIIWIGTHTDIHEQKVKEQQKDQFISIASHEMKTPLTTVKAYLQLLELNLEGENTTANLYAKKANQSVGRLNDLISELLDVSKIQNGKLNYNITSFNFDEMIDHTIENIQYTSSTHTIVKTGNVHKEVTGDKDRIQQVVINLLSNAIKYSPGKTKVFIDIKMHENNVNVAVKDEGIGIAPNHLAKIFERYYRVEDHAIQFQGLGIGLFISSEIIHRHQGEILAESEEGKGSTFSFSIPVQPAKLPLI